MTAMTTSPYPTATAALEALADQHETHGPSIHTRARITTGSHKVGLYIRREGSVIVGSNRTGGQYATPIKDIDRITRIEYAQEWLRDERGPLFVAEGA